VLKVQKVFQNQTRWNFFTAIKQKTRVIFSMLFTVPSNGGF
jgi:hypothetical protein